MVGGNKSSFPGWFIYIVVGLGLVFHSLNAYWFSYVLQKAGDAIGGGGAGAGEKEL